MDHQLSPSENHPSRVRSSLKVIFWILFSVLLAFGAVQAERLLGLGETGLGRHPEWSSYGQPDELAATKSIHDQFCHNLSLHQWEQAYHFYAEPSQRSVVENYLGVCCIIGYSWRSRAFDEELVEILNDNAIPFEGYLNSIETTSFDFRWKDSADAREIMFSNSDHVLDDPNLRRQLLADLEDWYRTYNGRRRVGYLRMFSNWIGPHEAFIHQSGTRAAFQQYSYGKHGKRLGWIEETQYLEKQNHRWRVTEFEIKLLKEAPSGYEE